MRALWLRLKTWLMEPDYTAHCRNCRRQFTRNEERVYDWPYAFCPRKPGQTGETDCHGVWLVYTNYAP